MSSHFVQQMVAYLPVADTFKHAGVICEITNDDGTMARAPEIVEFAKKFGYSVLTIEDLVEYRLAHNI